LQHNTISGTRQDIEDVHNQIIAKSKGKIQSTKQLQQTVEGATNANITRVTRDVLQSRRLQDENDVG
jgi:hypothetical protein